MRNISEPPRLPSGWRSLISGTEEPFYSPNYTPPQRSARPGELLFEFVRPSDRAPMACELRFHGESYGWEAQFLERGDLVYSRGAFGPRSSATRCSVGRRIAEC